jgi:hypothetical protein
MAVTVDSGLWRTQSFTNLHDSFKLRLTGNFNIGFVHADLACSVVTIELV